MIVLGDMLTLAMAVVGTVSMSKIRVVIVTEGIVAGAMVMEAMGTGGLVIEAMMGTRGLVIEAMVSEALVIEDMITGRDY